MLNGEANSVFKMGSLAEAVLVSLDGNSLFLLERVSLMVQCFALHHDVILFPTTNSEFHNVGRQIFNCAVADDLMDSLHH